MNFDGNISSTQIVRVIGLVLGLGVAVIVGAAVGNQDLNRLAMILGPSAIVATLLALGKDYWMLVPLSLGATRLPAVPLGGRSLDLPELAIAACSVMFLLRIATRKDKLNLWQPLNIPILLFTLWVAIVFILNPVGFALIGSTTGGGRFYFKVFLAFAAYIILANRTYTERDIRWIIGFIIFGAVFALVYGIANYTLAGPTIDQSTGMVQEEFYTWHQELSIPAFTITFLIFARYGPKQVFGIQRPWLPIVYALCLLAVLLSGKRLAAVAMIVAPLVSAVMYRQYMYIFVAAVLATVGASFLAIGQGQWFQLPLIAQRTISWLPGEWDPELESIKGGTDDWRAELRYWATENIKRNPIVGEGFTVDLNDTIAAITMQQRGGDMNVQVAAYALGRSWHNTWLGYAADFGIPLPIIQAVIFGLFLTLSARCFRFYGNSSLLGVFALYVFIYTVRDLVNTHTGGHSALDAWNRWWMYGIVAAVYIQTKAARLKARSEGRVQIPAGEENTPGGHPSPAFPR